MKKSIPFTKMHNAGNDYIYINGIESLPANLPSLAMEMSERHKGIGSDGLVVISASDIADFRMRIFNSDGSEGEMCGNASMCIAKFVFEHSLTEKTDITLETNAGVKHLHFLPDNDSCVSEVTVDVGEALISRDFVRYPIYFNNELYLVTSVCVGNQHGVVFLNELPHDISEVGLFLENNPIFPNKANIEFVRVDSANHLTVKVWERGSGETLACGTGAAASVAVAHYLGLCHRQVKVELPGGQLCVELTEDDNHLLLRGCPQTVYEGVYYYENK